MIMFWEKYKVTCAPEPGFMSKKEFTKYLFKTRRNKLVSMYESVPVSITNEDVNNALILGGGGSGISYFIEDKLMSPENNKKNAPSYIVFGQNVKRFEKLYESLKRSGYKIYNYRYWEGDEPVENNLTYNPFDWFTDNESIYEFVSTITQNYLHTDDKEMINICENLLISVMLYVNTSKRRTLTEVNRLLKNIKEYKKLTEGNERSEIYKRLQVYLSSGVAKTECLSLLKEAFNFSIYSVAKPKMLLKGKFDINILESKSVIFIDGGWMFREWLSSEIMTSFINSINSKEQPLKRHVKILYEVPQPGPIKNFESIAARARTHNFSIDIIMNNLESYIKADKINLESLLCSCKTFMYMGTKNEDDLMFSEDIINALSQNSKVTKEWLNNMLYDQCIVSVKNQKPMLVNKDYVIA